METVGIENRGNMKYTCPLDYTEQFTHNDRVKRNESNLYLDQLAYQTRDKQFENENNKSVYSLKYGLIDQDPSTTESALETANKNKYYEARYTGISKRTMPLDKSSSLIHDTPLKPDKKIITSSMKKQNTILNNKKIIKTDSFGVIQNTFNVPTNDYTKSKTIIYGDSNSNKFGIINNKNNKYKNIVSKDTDTDTNTSVIIPDRNISTKKPIPFGVISNPKQVSFGKIHKDGSDILQKYSNLGMGFSKNQKDYNVITRY